MYPLHLPPSASPHLSVKKPGALNHLVQLWLQKLRNGHVLAQTLPPSRFERQIPCHTLWRRWLKRPQLHLLVERVAGNNVPPVKDQRTECLALCVNAHVGFETEGVDDRDEALDVVEGCVQEKTEC